MRINFRRNITIRKQYDQFTKYILISKIATAHFKKIIIHKHNLSRKYIIFKSNHSESNHYKNTGLIAYQVCIAYNNKM